MPLCNPGADHSVLDSGGGGLTSVRKMLSIIAGYAEVKCPLAKMKKGEVLILRRVLLKRWNDTIQFAIPFG